MNATQLQLTLDKQAWQMTLAEFTETMVGKTRIDPNFNYERPIDLRGESDQAYVRVMHKRAIRRAIEDGHEVSQVIIREHPALASYIK